MNAHLKQVTEHHDWWAKSYDSDYFEHYGLYHRVTLDNIRRFLPTDKKAIILDAGGGTGIWSIELAKMGHKVTLADISEGMLKKAKEKLKKFGLENQIEILVSDICNMQEFSDDNFDMVLCEGDPLSYCGDHKKALKELSRVLKIGGIMIVSADNRPGALGWFGEKSTRGDVERLLETGEVLMPTEHPGHSYTIHAFTAQELKDLFESNGLSVQRIIGKLVIPRRLPWYRSKDHSVQQWLYKLELKYNDNPDFYPRAGHLEIVGRKKKR